MKNKKRPLPEEIDKFSLGSTNSATECTGLVMHMATEEEMEAYQEVYNFQATPAVGEEDRKQIKEGKNIF